jgi:hypothetical protein
MRAQNAVKSLQRGSPGTGGLRGGRGGSAVRGLARAQRFQAVAPCYDSSSASILARSASRTAYSASTTAEYA